MSSRVMETLSQFTPEMEVYSIDEAFLNLRELRGEVCYELEESPPTKKGITVSRSFGQNVTTLEHLKEATAVYTARAGEKLRSEGLAAGVICVFAMTSQFIENRYYNRQITTFEVAMGVRPWTVEGVFQSTLP